MLISHPREFIGDLISQEEISDTQPYGICAVIRLEYESFV